jgi:hypothetical protein
LKEKAFEFDEDGASLVFAPKSKAAATASFFEFLSFHRCSADDSSWLFL